MNIIRARTYKRDGSAANIPKKESDQWNSFGDFRALNAVIRPDRYLLPLTHSIYVKLHGALVFSRVDLVKAYHKIHILR